MGIKLPTFTSVREGTYLYSISTWFGQTFTEGSYPRSEGGEEGSALGSKRKRFWLNTELLPISSTG